MTYFLIEASEKLLFFSMVVVFAGKNNTCSNINTVFQGRAIIYAGSWHICRKDGADSRVNRYPGDQQYGAMFF